jgi:hypothetical protein
MTTTAPLDFVDSDGHVLEHPDGMLEYAPRDLVDRIWHIETDADGTEWCIYNDQRLPANGLALAGTAGMTLEERERAQRGELRYTEVRPAAYNARARLADMDTDGISRAIVYPTMLLGIGGLRDAEFADAQCRAYNDWLSDHVQDGEGRLYGVAIVPQQDIEAPRPRSVASGRSPGSWVSCCGRTRARTGSRSTTRCTTRCGARRPTPASPSVSIHS